MTDNTMITTTSRTTNTVQRRELEGAGDGMTVGQVAVVVGLGVGVLLSGLGAGWVERVDKALLESGWLEMEETRGMVKDEEVVVSRGSGAVLLEDAVTAAIIRGESGAAAELRV